MDPFTQFEHEGWKRVADKYDSVWSTSTRQFIPPLLDAANVSAGMSILDVGCGPGYVSAAAAERGAKATGLDFSKEMIAIARRMPSRRSGTRLCRSVPRSQAQRQIRIHRLGAAERKPLRKIIDDAINAHANVDVDLPAGPPHYLFAGREEFRHALQRAGFDDASMIFKLHMIKWNVPTARFVFDAERNAGVRTAGLLAHQTPEQLSAIQSAIESAVRPYAKGSGFAIPKAAFAIAVSKK